MSKTFINTGEFWDKHPGILPTVTSYERCSLDGTLVERWERNENGEMVDVTERVRLEREIAAAQAEIDNSKEV